MRITRFFAFLLLAAAAAGARPASAQVLRGRTVDDQSRQAVANATVTLLAADSAVIGRTTTDDDGFFQFRVRAGVPYVVEVRQIGFGTALREISVGTGITTVPAFVLRTEVIALDAIRADVEPQRDPMMAGSGRATHILAGERLAKLEQYGASMMNAVRTLNGPRTREYRERTGKRRVCVESTRAVIDMDMTPIVSAIQESANACNWIAFVIDGIAIEDPELLLRTLNPADFESIEFFSPAEAGSQYGLRASASGALVLWTRGRGPHVRPERTLR